MGQPHSTNSIWTSDLGSFGHRYSSSWNTTELNTPCISYGSLVLANSCNSGAQHVITQVFLKVICFCSCGLCCYYSININYHSTQKYNIQITLLPDGMRTMLQWYSTIIIIIKWFKLLFHADALYLYFQYLFCISWNMLWPVSRGAQRCAAWGHSESSSSVAPSSSSWPESWLSLSMMVSNEGRHELSGCL